MSQPLERPITGHGEHQYEVIDDWGNLPSSIEYGNTACKVLTVTQARSLERPRRTLSPE